MITVNIFLEDNKIIGKIVFESELFDTLKHEYAFFLYMDGFIYQREGYSKNLGASFDLKNESGVFHIKCFTRNLETAKVEDYRSKKIPINLKSYNIDRWNKEVTITNLDSFEKEVNNYDGIYQFSLDNSIVDILFDGFEMFKQQKGILVCFSAAIGSREFKQAPFFSGLNIAKKMGMPLIAIADSSLSMSNRLALSWYSGNQNMQDLPDFIASILDMISRKFNTQLTIFGGSGGGFAALSIVKKMSCYANVAVWNPQTSISKYTKKEVIHYIETCYPAHNLEDNLYKSLERLGINHDLLVTYSKSKKLDNILFLQNIGDTHHVEKHAKPFMKALDVDQLNKHTYISTRNRDVTFWLKDWGKGHIAPSEDIVLKLLSEMIANKSSKQIALQLH